MDQRLQEELGSALGARGDIDEDRGEESNGEDDDTSTSAAAATQEDATLFAGAMRGRNAADNEPFFTSFKYQRPPDLDKGAKDALGRELNEIVNKSTASLSVDQQQAIFSRASLPWVEDEAERAMLFSFSKRQAQGAVEKLCPKSGTCCNAAEHRMNLIGNKRARRGRFHDESCMFRKAQLIGMRGVKSMAGGAVTKYKLRRSSARSRPDRDVSVGRDLIIRDCRSA